MYEAEANGRDEVAALLLTEGKRLESAAGSSDDHATSGAGGEGDADGRLEEVMNEGDVGEQS